MSSSSLILPCSTNCISEMPIRVLEIDAMFCKLCGSYGTFLSISERPYPFWNNTSFWLTTATANPEHAFGPQSPIVFDPSQDCGILRVGRSWSTALARAREVEDSVCQSGWRMKLTARIMLIVSSGEFSQQ